MYILKYIYIYIIYIYIYIITKDRGQVSPPRTQRDAGGEALQARDPGSPCPVGLSAAGCSGKAFGKGTLSQPSFSQPSKFLM